MRDFKKSGGFKKSFGDRPSFGGRPAFGGGNRFGASRPGDRDKEMFQATCSDCGKSCEVPFRPVEGRPVFCRDCFAKNAPGAVERPPREEGGFKRPFNKFEDRRERPPFRPESSPSPRIDGTQMIALTKQLELLNIKLDRLIQTIEVERAFAEPKAAKKPAKKPAAKKK